MVGLHSHTHPTTIDKMSLNEQKIEYTKNRDILSKFLQINKSEIQFMSHPCGRV